MTTRIQENNGKMRLYFHKDPLGNVGDDLNPWLWPRIFPGLFDGEVFHEPARRDPLPSSTPLFVGIGTLLNENIPAENPKLIFGSGVGYGGPPNIDEKWEFIFVRGPLTAKKLGLPPDLAIVDPAVLAVDYFTATSRSPGTLAYMPHCASARAADWNGICDELGLRFIDPHWPVERVLHEISSTSTLLTEALHGAIFADSFRIPWVPINTSPVVLDFKWQDWCASVGLTYQPIRLETLWGAGSGLLSAAKYRIKRYVVKEQLRRLIRRNSPLLSDENKNRAVRDRLYEKVSAFSERFLQNHDQRPFVPAEF